MGVTNLITLLTGMTAGTFQRLSNPSESTLANALPATLANFDFDASLAPGGSTWPNNASIPDSSANSNPVFTWASACIDTRDGYVMQQGGGDQDTLRNAIMGFDVDAAAAAVNSGGSPTQKWDLLVKDGRYRAGSAARPSSGVSPTGAVTTTPDPVTGLWPMTNADGIAMPRTVHPWFSKVQVPGTGKMLLGGSSTFPDNTNGGSNAGFFFDRDTGLMTGPLPFVGGAPAHMSTSFGYPGQGPSVMPVYVSDLDGNVYTIQNTDNFAWIVARITNPLTSSIALTSTGVFDPSLSPNGFASWKGITDPANSSLRIIFQHASDGGTSSDANFLALSDPEGLAGGPTFNWQSYGSGSVTTTGPTWLVYAPDQKRGVVWVWDGDNLVQVTPGLTLTTWSIASVSFTGTAGSTAPSSPGGSGALLPGIGYIPLADALIFSILDEVWVFKPVGWAPPSPAAVWQNWGLGAWSTTASAAAGAGTAAGSATVSGVSAAIKKAAGSSAGVGAATGHGASLAKSAGSSAGVGAATGHGAALAKSHGTAAGVGSASGVGKSLALSHGTAAGVATASGVGKSLSLSHGTAAGVATVSGHGASLAKSVGNAAGLATVAGVGTSAGGGSTGVAAGVATVSGRGASLFAAHGTAAGVATVLGRSASIFAARGISAGLATVRGVSPSAAAAGIQSISRRGRKPNLPMGFE